MSENKKILYVINHIDWFWSHRLPLAKGAQAQDWAVDVAVCGGEADKKLRQEGFAGYDLPDFNAAPAPLALIRTLWALHKILAQQKPHVMHAITLKYAFMAGLAGRAHPKVKKVHTIAGLGYLFSGEGMKPKVLRALVGPLLRFALTGKNTSLIFQNPDDLALIVGRGFAKAEQCHLIKGSGVDLTEFKVSPLPTMQSPIVLMPTRLVHEKGIAVFIKAAKIVQQKNPYIRFHIAGGISASNPNAISQAQMEALLEGSPVEWLGKVGDMPARYKEAALICYPSYYGEGIPKVLLEAAATGRAIITTDHPGCREAVTPELNGLLAPVKDAHATAEAILSLCAAPDKLSAMGAASRKKAEEEFDVQKIVQRTLQVYEGL